MMRNNQKRKEKNTALIKIISIILVLLCGMYVAIIIKNQNYRLIPGVIGICAIIITMNIANLLKIKREKAMTFSMVSLVMSLLNIPLLIFVQVVFSYILSVPAFIIAKKSLKINNSLAISKIAYIISILMLVFCIILSLMGGFSYVSGPTVLN